MKTTIYFSTLMVALFALLILPAKINAQQQRQVRVQVDNIETETRRSPRFSSEQGYSEATPQDEKWLITAVGYEVRGGERGWVDDLTFVWHMLMLNGDVPRVLMQKTVTYQDVYQEDDHYAVIFLRPKVIRRYYEEGGKISERDIIIHLEVKHNGRTLTEENYNARSDLPERWWTFSPPKVNVVEHGLLARPETPFAPLDYDFYEFIKPE